jgi:hypothetical protein
MTNKIIATAGTLSLVLTAIHVIGGGADVHVPLLESDASDVLKGFVSVIWHGVTASLLMCSAMLLIAARHRFYRVMLTGLVISNYLAFTGLFLFYGITRLGSVLLMPPWIGFAIIAVVAAVGLSMDKSRSAYAQT